MARVFTDGAEFGDAIFFDTIGAASASTLFKRSGAYSYATYGTSVPIKNISATAEFYVRFGLYMGTAAANGKIFAWKKGTTELGQLRINVTGNKYELLVGAGVVATSSISYVTSTWYLIEMHIKIGNSPSGLLEFKVDGVSDASGTFAGDTQPGSDTTVDNIAFGGSNLSFYYDDLGLNDTAGSTNNSWVGDGHIKLVSPISDGDSSQLTCSTGTTHWALVDEIPSNTTDYVEGATGTSYYDLYGVSSSGLTGVNIRGVFVESRALSTAAVGATTKLLIKTGGYLAEGSAVPLLTTYTKQILGTYYEKNPRTSGTWAVSDLDTMQIGGRVP